MDISWHWMLHGTDRKTKGIVIIVCNAHNKHKWKRFVTRFPLKLSKFMARHWCYISEEGFKIGFTLWTKVCACISKDFQRNWSAKWIEFMPRKKFDIRSMPIKHRSVMPSSKIEFGQEYQPQSIIKARTHTQTNTIFIVYGKIAEPICVCSSVIH